MIQGEREALSAALRAERAEVNQLQKEVASQEQKGKILAAKCETLCLKQSAAGESDGSTETLVRPPWLP